MSVSRSVSRGATRVLAVLAALALSLLWSTAAFAHAVLDPGNAPAGEVTTFQVLIPHGCAPGEPPPPPGVEVEPTTLVSVEIPEGMMVESAEGFGDFTAEVTDTEIVWSGGSLENGDIGEFFFDAMLMGEEGEEIAVNVFQECDELSYRWVGAPNDAEPAPRVTVGAEAGEGHQHGEEGAEEHDHSDPAQHADGQAHDPDVESEEHDHSDPTQHADCMPHDPDVASEAVPAGSVDCPDDAEHMGDEAAMEADEHGDDEHGDDEHGDEEHGDGEADADADGDAVAQEASDEGEGDTDTDDGAAPAGGADTGQGGTSDGGPATGLIVGGLVLAGAAGVGALRRVRA